MHNWDDLRVILAVAEHGSVSSAAKELGVSHTTVLRRISGFEAETGSRLFERTAQGYVINPDRLKAFEAIRRAGRAVEAASAEVAAATVPPGEALRLTSTDSLCQTVLPEIVAELTESQPGLRIALFAFNTHLNLAHGQADLTVRPALSLPDDLEGEIVAHLGFGIYRSRQGADRWLGLSGPLGRSVAGEWMQENAGQTEVVADSFQVLSALAANGQGRALLPCIIGDADPRLQRDASRRIHLSTPLWVAGHKNLGDTGKINKFRRRLAQAFVPYKAALLGRDG